MACSHSMLCCSQTLYDGVDDVKKNKADKTQVEVEVREVSYN